MNKAITSRGGILEYGNASETIGAFAERIEKQHKDISQYIDIIIVSGNERVVAIIGKDKTKWLHDDEE